MCLEINVQHKYNTVYMDLPPEELPELIAGHRLFDIFRLNRQIMLSLNGYLSSELQDAVQTFQY